MNTRNLAVVALCLLPAFQLSFAAETAPAVKLTPLADRVRVEIGGQLFTEYIFGDGATKPYCYPVLAADGTPLTRNFPMKKVAGEDTDHPWHRSLYFGHSIVNGVDFWNESGGDTGKSPSAKGHTAHDKLLETTSGEVGVIRTQNRWVAPDGKIICTDERKISFHATAEARMIDCEVTLHAPTNEPVVMGDNKDGTMAMRLAQWLTMPHKSQGGGTAVTGAATNVSSASSTSKGHIVNSAGHRDNDVWGKRADWCDYYSEHDGKTYGVSIGNVVECEGGMMIVPNYWNATAHDRDGKVIKEFKGHDRHMQNFIDVVRSRKTADLFGPVDEGHVSSALCHLGNISYQVGRTMKAGELAERTKGNNLTAEATGRMAEHLAVHGIDFAKTPLTLGATLTVDATKENFTGEFSDTANKFITREYRAPFTVPQLA